jgi:transcriptional regulator
MYVPPHFNEDRVDVLHDAIRQARLGTLVTIGEGGLEASHVPMLVDPDPRPFGTLLGHVARANPQWRTAAADAEALAIFLGPDGYVSPSWYPTKRESGKVVPTWNYVAVHATGLLRFHEDPEWLLALVTRLTQAHEAPRAEPWSVSDAPKDYIAGMLRAIVGFELPIARLAGKWKMSQNRSPPDRAGVIEGLAREGGPDEARVAAVMAAAREP